MPEIQQSSATLGEPDCRFVASQPWPPCSHSIECEWLGNDMSATNFDGHAEIFFPVQIGPLCVKVGDGKNAEYIELTGRQAVVESETRRVISVVSDRYRLVTNQEALRYAQESCKTAFGEFSEAEWRIHLYTPPSRAWCRIDLEHMSSQLEFSTIPGRDIPDVFGPFVRVVNSYDRSHALSIEIGFMRKVCRNGLVLPKSAARFRVKHSETDIAEKVKFEIERKAFSDLKGDFLGMVGPLRQVEIPSIHFVPILCSALKIKKPEEPTLAEEGAWVRLIDDFKSLSYRYIDELGETAYALLNCVSEVATRPFGTVRRERHSLQRLAGEWLVDFSQRCEVQGFDVGEYVQALDGTSAVNGGPETGRLR